MLFLQTHITNCLFTSSDDGANYGDVAAARHAAIAAAGAIVLDEIISGAPSAIVEVRLEAPGGHAIERLAIAMSVAGLQTEQPALT